MAFLTDTQVQKIKEHMIAEDATMLASKFKSKSTPYDLRTIELNEVDDYENDGWEVVTTLKRKAKVQREKQTEVLITNYDNPKEELPIIPEI